MANLRVACILEQASYKPGDQAPEGYLAWHEWAEVQHKAGLRETLREALSEAYLMGAQNILGQLR